MSYLLSYLFMFIEMNTYIYIYIRMYKLTMYIFRSYTDSSIRYSQNGAELVRQLRAGRHK